MALAVGEGRDGGGRVLADAGEGEELRVVGGDVAAVAFRYGGGGAVQP